MFLRFCQILGISSMCSKCVQSMFNIEVISSLSASSVSMFGIFKQRLILPLKALVKRKKMQLFLTILDGGVFKYVPM